MFNNVVLLDESSRNKYSVNIFFTFVRSIRIFRKKKINFHEHCQITFLVRKKHFRNIILKRLFATRIYYLSETFEIVKQHLHKGLQHSICRLQNGITFVTFLQMTLDFLLFNRGNVASQLIKSFLRVFESIYILFWHTSVAVSDCQRLTLHVCFQYLSHAHQFSIKAFQVDRF